VSSTSVITDTLTLSQICCSRYLQHIGASTNVPCPVTLVLEGPSPTVGSLTAPPRNSHRRRHHPRGYRRAHPTTLALELYRSQ
jgi:hypothetical protein